MAEPLAPELVEATLTDGRLVRDDDGTALNTQGQGIGRQVNSAAEGAKFKVLVVENKVIEIVENESGEKHRQEQKEKQEDKEAFAKLLKARKVAAKILPKTTEHLLPNREGRRQHLIDQIDRDDFTVVVATNDTFTLRIPVRDDKDWLVTGYYKTTRDAVKLSIDHYGRGSAY